MALSSRLAKQSLVSAVPVAGCRPVARPFTALRPSRSVVAASVVAESPATAAASAPRKLHPSPLTQAPPALYAVIEIGGTQLFVEPGKWYTCNRLAAEPGSTIKFGRVLALKKDGQLSVGRPFLENVSVEADILEELRGPKILVYKMKPKKHYRKMQGHRQDLTKFMVTSISS